MTTTLAHLSDLHLGRDAATDEAARALCEALVAAEVDDVLVTGDVTHRGAFAELALFERIFAPLRDRLLVVPGNHDRLGEDAARAIMGGARVAVSARPGAFVVRFDSTAAHNRHFVRPHGELTPADVAGIDAALARAPAGDLTVLMLHHHLLPLPADDVGERIATWLGWSMAMELALGRELIGRLRGRCDLVLHGHRHRASELVLLPRRGRALHVLNAGCSPELGRVRLLTHADGRVVSDRWLEALGGGVPAPGETGQPHPQTVAA